MFNVLGTCYFRVHKPRLQGLSNNRLAFRQYIVSEDDMKPRESYRVSSQAETVAMRFSPYHKTRVANIVVDGSPNDSTILTLSHWPKSGTRTELKADTSAEIAFKYLDSPRFHVDCDVVTNNHFDQDGLIAAFTLIDPITATRHRDLLIDAASAGDFGVFKSRDAVRINFAIAALADPETSPLPPRIFTLNYPEMAAELYVHTLVLLPRLTAEPNEFKSLWENEDSKLTESEEMLRKGIITIEEERDFDFAVVRLPEQLAPGPSHRFTASQQTVCHPLAIYNATPCTRVLLVQGQHVEFQYRYEGWVQLISRKPAARVDLSALAVQLDLEERSGGRWASDGVDAITPRLHLEGSQESSIPAETIRQRVEQHLRGTAPAWDPYDP
jgi:hypothetical protein